MSADPSASVEARFGLRAARESDHPIIVGCIERWWEDARSPQQARELALMLPRLFLQHFAGTSLVAEDTDSLAGFLVGFYSADHRDQAYVHFLGVDPSWRRSGVASLLVRTFCERARSAGRREVRLVTSPSNTASIAFHLANGFEVDGLPVRADYDGPGQDRVCLSRRLERV